jgi:outer membrane receptor for monomeric catechols
MVGDRTTDTAKLFVADLASRLANRVQTRPAVHDFSRNAVTFTAMNGRRLVRFRVTRHALASMAKRPARSEMEMIDAHKSHTERIHEIAERKFSQRLIDTDGTVLVIQRDVD